MAWIKPTNWTRPNQLLNTWTIFNYNGIKYHAVSWTSKENENSSGSRNWEELKTPGGLENCIVDWEGTGGRLSRPLFVWVIGRFVKSSRGWVEEIGDPLLLQHIVIVFALQLEAALISKCIIVYKHYIAVHEVTIWVWMFFRNLFKMLKMHMQHKLNSSTTSTAMEKVNYTAKSFLGFRYFIF